MLNRILDKSVIFSFDRSGFLRHQKHFEPEKLQGNEAHALITGISSGIGLAAAETLISLGTRVLGVARSPEKAAPHLSSNLITLKKLDMGRLEDIIKFSASLTDPFNILIHNAGSMPLVKTITPKGYEEIFASQVIGPYFLTRSMIENNKLASGSKIIFVSSGGMYLKNLDLSDIHFSHTAYSRYQAYANAKRAQVCLTRLFEKHYPRRFFFSAMHPGWVDTPGVEHSMPWFYTLLKSRFRTPSEGADTLVWLALTQKNLPSGKFWFDRKQAPEAFFALKGLEEEENKLWNLLDNLYTQCR